MKRITLTPSILAIAALGACSDGAQPTEVPSEPRQAEAQAIDAGEETTAASPAETAATEGNASTAEPVAVPEEVVEAQDDGMDTKRVSFQPGANSATVEGSITGSDSVDYVLNVREGQPMNISMATQNSSAYLNIYEPGETVEATHIGSISGNQFEGVAAKSGDYRIRVFLMRNAARRNEKADYRLEMIVG